MKYILLFAISFALLTSQSCSRVEPGLKNPDSGSIKALSEDISSIRGVLRFKSSAAFQKSVMEISNWDESRRKSFEQSQKFVSLKSFFKDAVSKSQSGTLPNDYSKEGMIALENGRISLNFFSHDMANLITKEGFVIIGKTLYQFSNEKVKFTHLNSTFENALALLRKGETSDKGVFVNPIKQLPIKLPNNSGARVGEGNYTITSLYENGSSHQGNSLWCVQGTVTLRTWAWGTTQCEYTYYDPSCDCVQCGGEVTYDYGQGVALTASSVSLQNSQGVFPWSGRETFLEQNAREMNITVDLTMSYDGQNFPYSFNFGVTDSSVLNRDIYFNYYSNIQDTSSLGVDGHITFRARHSQIDFWSTITMYL